MKVLASIENTGNMSYAWTGIESANTISFANDGTDDAVITIHNSSITVKPGESLDVSFPVKFLDVDIVTTSAWRMLIGD